ncbi:MAG: hypothetical protein E4H27_01785 [Anaerolineales bacterium]|nr:MAG: hypothetical protein E4H27_01785 [Anaerolineales bacterium]
MDNAKIFPIWAPRITQREVRRLYETDAKGIYDEDLINEVGYGLLARCQSFIDANEARAGQVRCPRCSSIVTHTCRSEEILRCDCGWELTWGEYFKTIQHVQLSGAEPVLEQFRSFISTFSASRTPQAKMLAIDQLIHGFHWYYKTNNPTRPVAVNLIEGRLSDVVAFLDQLTYGDESTPGLMENYAQWDEKIEMNRNWYASYRERRTRTENPPDGQ